MSYLMPSLCCLITPNLIFKRYYIFILMCIKSFYLGTSHNNFPPCLSWLQGLVFIFLACKVAGLLKAFSYTGAMLGQGQPAEGLKVDFCH